MTQKLDAEHVENLQKLRTQYTQVVSALGQLSLEQQYYEQQLQSIETRKQGFLQQYDSLKAQENTLIEELKARYGEGEINLETGTFTATPAV